MLTEEQKKELDKDIQTIVDERVQKQVEDRLAKEIVKRFTPSDVIVIKDAGDQPWKSFGEQLIAVKDAAISQGRIMDARLKAPTGLSEGQPSEGGFLVGTDYATSLLEKVFASSDIVSRVTRFPVSSGANARKIPAVSDANRADGSRSGGIRAYWAAEAGTKTPSQAAFDQVSLELKKLVGLCYVTDELLEDAPFLEAWIRNAFNREFDFKIADAIVNGDGSGKPLGILNAPCTYAITAESGQGASTIVAENVIKMWAARFGPNTMNYVWLINQNIEPQLYTMGLSIGAGGIPVYMPAGGLSQAPYGMLFGRPVIPCEQAAALGTAGDIILADLSQYIMIDKGTAQAASSIHVKFITDETAFRFTYRCDGQPWWKTYITPYKGTTSYQSCFVTLSSTRT
jgi:HK97 family phage major capsid protein